MAQSRVFTKDPFPQVKGYELHSSKCPSFIATTSYENK